MLVLVSSVDVKRLGQCSNFGRQDGDLNFRTASIGPSAVRTLLGARVDGGSFGRKDLVGVVPSKFGDNAPDVGVVSVLAAGIVHASDSPQSFGCPAVLLQ